MSQTRRGVCLVFVSPSGAGKTTLMQRLLALDEGLSRSVSATTRAPRAGEVEAEDYYFCTREKFDALVEDGGMLEHATVFGKSYGIPRQPVLDALEAGRDVVFVIDWQGHLTLKEQLPGDVVGIYIVPPSLEELERRLIARGDRFEDVVIRMQAAPDEMEHHTEFTHIVANDDLDQAVADVQAILEEERENRRNPGLALSVAA